MIKIGDTVVVLIPWWNQSLTFGPFATGVVKSISPARGDRETYCCVQFENDDMWVGISRVDVVAAKEKV